MEDDSQQSDPETQPITPNSPIKGVEYTQKSHNREPTQENGGETHKKFITPPPFPGRLARKRKEDRDKEIFEVFRRVEVNIPLLDILEQIPSYVKFLRECCTKKHRLDHNARVLASENVSAVIQRRLPAKCKDPGMYAIPIVIGEQTIDKVMLDLGASINVMPLSLYKELKLGPMKTTRIVIQLADRSNTYPVGMVEDILVKTRNLIFPADFYVINMDNEDATEQSLILLGRPFLKNC
jgi:hypothetical protein